MPESDQILNSIKSEAKKLGFLDCVILPAGFLSEEKRHFLAWIENGMNGEMGYMARNIEKRLDPRLLVENARTIIVVLQNYFPDKTQTDHEAPVLSKYAYGADYHFVIKNKLKKLLDFIQKEISPCNGRGFVDSAPVLERAWARKAGLGWIGKNSNLISVEHGSFFFIGELILDIELPSDKVKEVRDHCGTCTRCIDACPTRAIVAGRVVDARKCISYQTIELKGNLDESLRGKFQNRVFGCDICQDVCPWNLKSAPHNEPEFAPKSGLLNLAKKEWFEIDKAAFGRLFRNSAVERAGFDGIKRNLRFIGTEGDEQNLGI